jgi:crotonobetainyl-CoA:carnitine CoA-transferase CaiB-like acyl-CoA transferase
MLGDLGARVVKIEDPRGGDETRRWGPPFLGTTSTYFLSVNRNKESIAIDLGSEEGRALAQKLIARADVVVDNFLPSQRPVLGVDDVAAINPRAVHCSITGYDPDTPEAGTPGYDLLAQAGSGLMSITGDAGGEPSKIGVALADVLTAHHAFGAICAALVERAKTGRGTRVEVSIFSSTLASLVNVAQGALATGTEARRYGNAHPSIVPYQIFHAMDRPFAMGGATERHFRLLCERVIERPELASDERFATNPARVGNRETLVTLLDAIFRTRPASEWIERLRAVAIPCSLVQGVLEALRSPAGAQLLVKVEHPDAGTYETVRHPALFDGERGAIRIPPPLLGEQTAAVARELSDSARTGRSSRETGTPPARP